MMFSLSKWSEEILGAFRIVAAFMFIQHGTSKLFNFPVPFSGDTLELFSLIGVAGILEVFGGILLLIGLSARPVAFVLSGEMALAYFIAHAPRGLWTIENGGDAAVLYCFAFLYIAAAGGGKWSVDSLRGAR